MGKMYLVFRGRIPPWTSVRNSGHITLFRIAERGNATCQHGRARALVFAPDAGCLTFHPRDLPTRRWRMPAQGPGSSFCFLPGLQRRVTLLAGSHPAMAQSCHTLSSSAMARGSGGNDQLCSPESTRCTLSARSAGSRRQQTSSAWWARAARMRAPARRGAPVRHRSVRAWSRCLRSGQASGPMPWRHPYSLALPPGPRDSL